MADYGTRKCKYCQEEFKKRAPIDTYCSVKCNILAKKARDDKKGNTNKPKPIAKFSSNRAKRNAAYLVANKLFLTKDENKFCPVIALLENKTVPATEVHHTNGREGERLNDQKYWLGVSRKGHQWIHANPELARESGWLTKNYKE